MPQNTYRQLVTLATMLLLLGLAACGGGAAPLGGSNGGINAPAPAAPAAGNEETPAAPGNRLTLSMPALATLTAGSEFDVVLSGEFSEEVYQGSARITYDIAALEAISAERGRLLPDHMLHIAGLSTAGQVPFAFTAQPGEQGIAAGSGELLRLRFRLKGAPAATRRPGLQNSPEFLQLRDRQGRRLSFDIASETGVQQ
jgi:hypothetical protein